MIDFIIAATAIAAVIWALRKKLNSSKDKGFCGFDCGACERKCKY